MADPDPGGGAARVAAGMLAAVTELHYGEEMLLGLNLASAARYPEFVAELEAASGRETGFRTCGTLAVALDSDDRAHLRELHALQERSGLESVWLSGRECRRLEPMLAPGVRAGCGWTVTTRWIRAGSPPRCWPPASGPGWCSAGPPPSGSPSPGPGRRGGAR